MQMYPDIGLMTASQQTCSRLTSTCATACQVYSRFAASCAFLAVYFKKRWDGDKSLTVLKLSRGRTFSYNFFALV